MEVDEQAGKVQTTVAKAIGATAAYGAKEERPLSMLQLAIWNE
jgi:hypothetical protein